MENIFFNDWQSIVRILVISVSAYISLVLILRISGKRTLSKMNAFDFIVTIALGSTLATVILDKSIALSEGITAFSVLVTMQFIITYLSSRSTKISKLVKSAPTMIAYKGELLMEAMLSERINEDEVWAILREKGFSTLAEADAIVLETDGSLTVISKISDKDAQPIKVLFKENN